MSTVKKFEGTPVAAWIIPRLRFARQDGWTGTVISGYRTDAEQLSAARRYAASLGKTVAQVYPHGALASNHCGLAFPRGAVDVTDSHGLNAAMLKWRAAGRPNPLVWGLPVINDAPHFSHTGH